jgi:hypothetical protein
VSQARNQLETDNRQSKKLMSSRQHGVISQVIELFITTDVKTSNPTIGWMV